MTTYVFGAGASALYRDIAKVMRGSHSLLWIGEPSLALEFENHGFWKVSENGRFEDYLHTHARSPL